MRDILQYLKEHGEKLDSEIAVGTGISLANVRLQVLDLSASGQIMMCHVTRFKDGKKSEGMLCRVAGHIPPVSPGRKSKAQS